MNGIAFRHHFRVPLDAKHIASAMLKSFDQTFPAHCRRNQLRRQDIHALMVQAVHPQRFRVVTLVEEGSFGQRNFMDQRLPSQLRTEVGYQGIIICSQILIQRPAKVYVQELKTPADPQDRNSFFQGGTEQSPLIPVALLDNHTQSGPRLLPEKRRGQILAAGQQQAV